MQLLSVFEDFNFWIGMCAHAQSIPIVFRQQNNKKMTIMYKTTNAYRMKTATCILFFFFFFWSAPPPLNRPHVFLHIILKNIYNEFNLFTLNTSV